MQWRPLQSVLTVAALAFALAAPALPQDLYPLRRYDTGGVGMTAIAVGDLNADGRLDVAAANHDTSSAGILLARPGGGFEATWSFFAGNGITDLAIADFDLDGRDDIVAVSEFGFYVNVGFLPAVPGTDPTWWSIGGMHGVRAVDVGDIDGDGDVDIVTADIPTSTISVLLGAGAGGVAGPVSYPTGTDPLDVVLADFDGDGDLDVASISQATDAVSVLIDVGAGVLAAPVSHPVGNDPRQLVSVDLDGDGDMDLAASTADVAGLSLLFGDGAGGFAPVQSLDFAGSTDLLVAADVNADGLVDLVADTSGIDGNRVGTRLGSSGGGFGPVLLHDEPFDGPAPYALAVADADGDDRLDLLVATPSVTVFPGDGEGGWESVPKPGIESPALVDSGDLDGDGRDDLVLADANGTSVRLADGQGAWGEAVPLGFSSTVFLHLRDENGDGHLDVLTIGYDVSSLPPTANLRIADGDGAGGFGAPVDHPFEWLDATCGEPGDLDGDGDLDLALVTWEPVPIFGGEYSYLTTLINDGDYRFAAPVKMNLGVTDPSNTPPHDHQLRLADANGDGDLDFFVRGQTVPLSPGANLNWVKNDGAGHPTFGGGPVHNGTIGFALGDLNADGLLDAAVTYFKETRVRLGIGGGAFAAPITVGAGSDKDLHIADIDQDGRLDVVVGAAIVFRGLANGGFERSSYFAHTESDLHRDLVLDVDGDGWLDVLAFTSSLDGTPGRVLLNHVLLSAWKDFGHGLAGSFGIPRLVGQGTLKAGSPGWLKLTRANPSKLAVLFIGATANPTPFKGGVLVPVPPSLMFTLFTSPTGTINVGWSSWKLMPPGTDWFFQYGVVDSAAPAGASLSNALRLLQP